jgi:hypothetical protein
MMKKVFLIIPFFILLSTLFSQEKNLSLFATDISAVVKGVNVELSWKESKDLTNEIYHIYRSSKRIITASIDSAQLIGTVDELTQSFTDTPPQGGTWYYLVTAEDNENHYTISLPYRNTTGKGVFIDQELIDLADAVKIENLRATRGSGKIHITFDRGLHEGAVSLYRSTKPIADVNSLSKSLLLTVLEGSKHSWLDEPIPGIAYYYAAVDRDLLANTLNKNILYGGNYTTDPVSLPLSDFLENPYALLPVRKIPLPLLDLDNYYKDLPRFNITFPERRSLSTQLDKKLANFLSDSKPTESAVLSPRILEDDETSGSSPIDDQLKKILGEFFLKNRWQKAQEELLNLLDQGEDQFLNNRIHFYRGQCFFFMEEYEMAYFEFLLSRKDIYQISNEWMKACLNNI